MPALQRRSLILGAITTGGSLLTAVPSRAAPAALRFEARRDGDPIGHHTVSFDQRAARLIVEIEISLTVTFAFIPVFRYRHRNREVWADGRLVALDSKTDDDGAMHRVSAQADGRQLLVEGTGGRLTLPGDTLPTSYWNDATVTRQAWLNTQDGRLVRSTVEALPPEPILAAGRTVEAEHYRLAGDIDCDLWYQAGRWSKLRFVTSDGSTIDYLLEPGAGAAS
jgi:Domain of unknown function (DUF6134)